jgi:hypothetical protein
MARRSDFALQKLRQASNFRGANDEVAIRISAWAADFPTPSRRARSRRAPSPSSHCNIHCDRGRKAAVGHGTPLPAAGFRRADQCCLSGRDEQSGERRQGGPRWQVRSVALVQGGIRACRRCPSFSRRRTAQTPWFARSEDRVPFSTLCDTPPRFRHSRISGCCQLWRPAGRTNVKICSLGISAKSRQSIKQQRGRSPHELMVEPLGSLRRYNPTAQ